MGDGNTILLGKGMTVEKVKLLCTNLRFWANNALCSPTPVSEPFLSCGMIHHKQAMLVLQSPHMPYRSRLTIGIRIAPIKAGHLPPPRCTLRTWAADSPVSCLVSAPCVCLCPCRRPHPNLFPPTFPHFCSAIQINIPICLFNSFL